MNSDPGQALGSVKAEIVFDLETASPELFAAACKSVPALPAAIERLRAGIPVLRSAAPGVDGDFYRLKKHNRAVCLPFSGDKGTSDVVVLKGTEPLLPDFAPYLDWMRATRSGRGVRSTAEHFPLLEGKTPGCVHLDEARGEAAMALELQRKHLTHYGELARVPTPLLVYRVPNVKQAEILTQVRARISRLAMERVEAHLERGVGVYAYYYPAPPVRVHAVGHAECFLPGQEWLSGHEHVIGRAIPRWVQLFARMLWLGYLPVTPLAWRLGACFDPNNACLDGGVCDIATVLPMAEARDDGFFGQSFFFSFGALRQSVSCALGIPLDEVPTSYGEAIVASCLEDSLRRSLEKAMETEARDSLSLDPRVLAFHGEKSLGELLRMFHVLRSDLGHSDYPMKRS